MVIVAVATQIAKAALVRRAVKVLLVLVPVIAACWVVGALLLTMLFIGGQLPPAAAAPAYGCTVTPAQGSTTSLDNTQLRNAATIVAVGKQLEVPPYGQAVAIATALQESGLRALDHGHLDSLGLFQQRASWGTAAQRMDPAWSARKFFTSLLQVPGWQTMPLTVAAQSVQASGFPEAYAAHESLARSIVGIPSVAGSVCEEDSGSSETGATEAELVAFGRELQALGVTVGEHPDFPGGVFPVHGANSLHYRRGAIDINYDGHQGGEAAMLDSLVPMVQAAGFRAIWHNTILNGAAKGTHVPGHEDHMHIDIGK